MDQKRIVIDGNTYRNVNEMPQDIREKYLAALKDMDKNQNSVPDMLENANAFFEDKNNNGVPDAFDGITSNVIKTTRIIANGKEYNSLDELPPDIRARLDQAMGKLDSNQDGMPDMFTGTANAPIQRSNIASAFETETPRRTQPVPAPVIEPESTSGWMIALAGLLILILCAAAGFAAWYFFLR